jgi:basic amino acid/polyamine antiporter, APA family
MAGEAPPRPLGFWSAVALVVGYTIGVGIFLTPAEVIRDVGSPPLTLALWIACGALAFAGALTFGELAARYPHAGGPYVYLREAWGDRAAFLYGWQSALVMDPGVAAAIATGAAPYLVVLWPGAGESDQRWLALAMIWAAALVAAAGLTLSARALIALTITKMFALCVVVVVAFARGAGSWAHFAATSRAPSGIGAGRALASGLVAVFFSFGGFWEASRVADAVRRPARTLPLALACGVGLVTLAYIATTAAFIYLVPPERASTPGSVARAAGEAMFGAAGPRLFAGIVITSVGASAIAMLIMAPRLYVAMSADGVFPAALASISPRTGTPVGATVLLATLASLFALAGTFRQITAFFLCPTLAFIAIAAAGLFPVRRRAPMAGGFPVPGHPLSTVFFVALLVAVVAVVAVDQPLQALTGFGVVVAGIPAYRWTRRSGRAAMRLSSGVD